MFNPNELRQARGFCGLSQTAVVNATGINRSYLSQFENGKMVLPDHDLEKLSELYEDHGWKPALQQSESSQATDSNATSYRPTFYDGIQIPENFDSLYAEELLDELHTNDEKIQEIMNQETPIDKGLLGLGEEADWDEIYKKMDIIKNLMARNYCIVRELHGRECMLGVNNYNKESNVEDGKEVLPLIKDYIGFSYRNWDFQKNLYQHEINNEGLEVEAIA